MRNNSYLGLVFSLVLVVGLAVCGVKLFHEQQQLQKQDQVIHRLKSEKKEETTQRQLAESRNEAVQKQLKQVQNNAEKTRTIQNNDATSEVRKEFSERVTTLFTTMYTFSPEDYGTRQKKVKGLLSEALIRRYFSEKQTMGDSNGVSSKLVSCAVYSKAVNGAQLEGIVLAKYSSGMNGEQQKAMNLFSVTYDAEHHCVTDIQNLGSGYTGDLLDEE